MIPVLEASPGMMLAAVRAASTVDLELPPVDHASAYVQPHEPHVFRLRDAKRGFETALGLFSVLEADGGVVFRLRTTPSLDYLSEEDGLALASGISDTLEQRGWAARNRVPQDRSKRHLADAKEDRVSAYLADEWMAEVWIRRVVERSSAESEFLALPHDGHLVTLVVWDVRLAATAATRGSTR